MANKEWFDMNESGNWNVAGDYTKLKIMQPLYYIDLYETIATFGTSDMIDEFVTDENTKNVARMKAIKRLVKTMLQLISNTNFAIKKDDKEKFKEWKTTLKKIENIIPALQTKTINMNTKISGLKINEEKFNKILEMIIDIKEKLNEPLNKADLIFTYKEEFDPEEYKEAIKNNLINRG